jgi:hypothetical protein
MALKPSRPARGAACHEGTLRIGRRWALGPSDLKVVVEMSPQLVIPVAVKQPSDRYAKQRDDKVTDSAAIVVIIDMKSKPNAPY